MNRIVALLLFCMPVLSWSQSVDQVLQQVDVLRSQREFPEAKLRLWQLQKKSSLTPSDQGKIWASASQLHLAQDHFATSRLLALKAVTLGQSSSDLTAQAYGHYALSKYYYLRNQNRQAFQEIYLARSLAEKMPRHDPLLFGKINYQIFSLSAQMEDAKMAQDYAQKTLQEARRSGNQEHLANAYTAKATALGFGELPADTDSIRRYLIQAVQVYQKNPLTTSQYSFGLTSVNLANQYYLKLKQTQNRSYQDSINLYLDQALALPKLGDHHFTLRASILGMKAEILNQNGQPKQAERLLLLARQNLLNLGKGKEYYSLMNVAQALQDLYAAQGRMELALKFSEEKFSYSRKEYDANLAAQAQELESKFQNERLQARLIQEKQAAELHRLRFFALALGVVLLTVGMVYGVRRMQRTLRRQQHQARQLEIEKQQADTLLKLETETKARLLAEQKILVLEQEKMKRQAMSSALILEQKNQTLDEIKKQVQDSPALIGIKQVLKQEQRISSGLEVEENGLENLHPQFFQLLQQATASPLTSRDRKLCAYLYLGLENKELASLLHIEPKSIRMSKYRLKQKLGLGPEQDLQAFLQALTLPA